MIRTNKRFKEVSEAAERYKELWKVERVFRDVKDLFKVSPIWHRKSIKGHIYACFLSLVIGSILKEKL